MEFNSDLPCKGNLLYSQYEIYNIYIYKFTDTVFFFSDKVDIPPDGVTDNLQDPDVCHTGMNYEQCSFVKQKTRATILAWLAVNPNDLQSLKAKKGILLDQIKSHKPSRNRVYGYIKYLPDYLPKWRCKNIPRRNEQVRIYQDIFTYFNNFVQCTTSKNIITKFAQLHNFSENF